MEALTAIIVIIGGIVLFPAIIGLLWVVCIGGPIYGCMKLWEIVIGICVNPAICVVSKVPILGRLISSFVAVVIVIVTTAFIFVVFEVPVVLFIAKAMGN